METENCPRYAVVYYLNDEEKKVYLCYSHAISKKQIDEARGQKVKFMPVEQADSIPCSIQVRKVIPAPRNHVPFRNPFGGK